MDAIVYSSFQSLTANFEKYDSNYIMINNNPEKIQIENVKENKPWEGIVKKQQKYCNEGNNPS